MPAIHLGAVMAFFLTMPYGKFAHGVFRSATFPAHHGKTPVHTVNLPA